MIRSRIMPLRRSTGTTLPVDSIQLLECSSGLQPQQIQAIVRSSPTEVDADSIYTEFIPPVVLLAPGQAPLIGPEVGRFSLPSDLPIVPAGKFVSIFISGPQVTDLQDSRKLWAEFLVKLAPTEDKKIPVVGGALLGGYPYMPSYLSAQGETSANHGLPREMRLSWRPAQAKGFIDDEVSITHQIPAWHSGCHIIQTNPVTTDQLWLRLADFPRRFGSLRSWDPNTRQYQEYWAIAIPYLFFFAYEEGIHYNANQPAGVVTATQTSRDRPNSFFTPAMPHPEWSGAESTFLQVASNGRAYPYTPQSAVLPVEDRRQYPVGPNGKLMPERFISNQLKPSERVHLFIAQREENPRCLAGLRLQFGYGEINTFLSLAETKQLEISVYELDPIPGTPIAGIGPDLPKDRYARLLGSTHLENPQDELITMRFVRPTLAQHFCIEFQAPKGGFVVLDQLSLVQSAQVSIAPRLSRKQVLRSLHLRLLGPSLGNDYAVLGEAGFFIAVDRVVAGEPRETLFQAYSLEELVRTGLGRLIVNSRSRAAEKQYTRTLPKSYLETANRSRNQGWERSESGKNINAPTQWQGDSYLEPDGQHGFNQMGNDENRVHVRHVAHLPTRYRNEVKALYSELEDDFTPTGEDLWKDNGAVWKPWQAPTVTAQLQAFKNRLKVRGLWNVSIPPYFSRLLDRVSANGGMNMGSIQVALNELVPELFLINGAGVGASMGFGVLIPNWSWSNNISASGVANALSAHSQGTTGSISLSARLAGYSYSQSLTAGGSSTQAHTDFLAGENRQLAVRSLPDEVELQNYRLPGAEVAWNAEVKDLVIVTIPLGYQLPALTDPAYKTSDDALRIRFGPLGGQVEFDAWFDIEEEVVRDDY